jgi:hypothetical protein
VRTAIQKWKNTVIAGLVVLMGAGWFLLGPAMAQPQKSEDAAAKVQQGTVTFDDLEAALSAIIEGRYDPGYDVNKDGKLDMYDLEILNKAYEQTPEGQAQLEK